MLTVITSQKKLSLVQVAYNLKASKPSLNNKCKSPLDDEDCCICLQKANYGGMTCDDTGCIDQGGFCVDMKKVNLKSDRSFPRRVADLDKRIEGDLCGKKSNGGCQCYRRKG